MTATAPQALAVAMDTTGPQRISIVVPVYAGETTLPALIEEIAPLTQVQTSAGGHAFEVVEVLLVHDCGPDRSDRTLEALSAAYPFVRPIWLSRNYGQHAATVAGMSAATGDWVVTIDEDRQQDPADIPALLDHALRGALQVVYAQPTNTLPYGWLRNTLSRTAKLISSRMLGHKTMGRFNSFRLVDGDIARTLAGYCANGVYLDVGLFWISGRVGHCPVLSRNELVRPSGYSYVKLIGHFWRLILTTGTRPLRLITLMGCASIVLSVMLGVYALAAKFYGQVPVQGWTSLVIVVAFFSGAILASLGVIAEYLAVTMGIVMGKPLFVVSAKPTRPAPRPGGSPGDGEDPR